MKYTAVVFDLFHTLVDSPPHDDSRRNLLEMASAIGAPGDEFARLWANTYTERSEGVFATTEAAISHVCAALDVQPKARDINAASAIRVGLLRHALVPRPGAAETLAELRKSGRRIGLLSNCTTEIPLVWKENPLAPLVDVPVFSCNEALRKPDERIYHLAAERLHVNPQDCLYIGDGESDELTGASKAGMHPVLIRVPHRALSEGSEAGSWLGPAIASLGEVLTLVEG